jgi:hypothetical protein
LPVLLAGLADEDLADEALAGEDLTEGFALAAVFLVFGLRRAEEREVIVWETCVQRSQWRGSQWLGSARFKSALSGFGQSAPIRDK